MSWVDKYGSLCNIGCGFRSLEWLHCSWRHYSNINTFRNAFLPWSWRQCLSESGVCIWVCVCTVCVSVWVCMCVPNGIPARTNHSQQHACVYHIKFSNKANELSTTTNKHHLLLTWYTVCLSLEFKNGLSWWYTRKSDPLLTDKFEQAIESTL